MGLKIYINSKFYEKKDAKISVFDHGLLYGDGVFEGIRSYNRLVFKLKEHVERLYESAHTIMLKIPLKPQEMVKAVVSTLELNKLEDAYIRVVITRGIGDLGLDPRKCKGNACVIIIADKIVFYPQKLYKEGLKIITVPTVRNLPEALNPQIKSLNYLNNILAKIEANNCGFQEAIMLDSLGYVAECTGDNIFVVRRGIITTTPPNAGILEGITRNTVIRLAREAGTPVEEAALTRHDIFVAEECFLTGTAAEVIAVVSLDGRTIGTGKPGEITKDLLRRFRQLTQAHR